MRELIIMPVNVIIGYRQLILQLIHREIIGRYRGSFLGLLWSFFHPILMLSIYTFIFTVVFKAHWGSETEGKTEFAIILFSGLIIHSIFAEVLNSAPRLILNNVNYVKKVVFPLEILPIILLGSALFHSLISFCVLLVAMLPMGYQLSIEFFLLPVILFPYLLLILGFSWFLASLGVYLRDIGQLVSVLTTALLFLSPIFYSIDSLPQKYQNLILLSPITFIVQQVRGVLFWESGIDWKGLGLYSLISMLIMVTGFYWFQKTRKGFADVI